VQLVSPALKFLYQNDDLFVLQKPAGIHTVSLPVDTKLTLARQLLEAAPSLASVALKEEDAGLVQRLDFETSGVLLGAKRRETWESLRALLQKGAIRKSYLIVTEGTFPERREVDTFLGNPNRRGSTTRVYTSDPGKRARALPAHSSFRRVSYRPELDVSLVRVTAPSARRHQVRAHSAHCGHPLLGDARYGARRSVNEIAPRFEHAPSFLLHAEMLEFVPPGGKEPLIVHAPLPEYFPTFDGR
jgi:23S rRNA-/tRNA-specific pseudouridylate synthase